MFDVSCWDLLCVTPSWVVTHITLGAVTSYFGLSSLIIIGDVFPHLKNELKQYIKVMPLV